MYTCYIKLPFIYSHVLGPIICDTFWISHNIHLTIVEDIIFKTKNTHQKNWAAIITITALWLSNERSPYAIYVYVYIYLYIYDTFDRPKGSKNPPSAPEGIPAKSWILLPAAAILRLTEWYRMMLSFIR